MILIPAYQLFRTYQTHTYTKDVDTKMGYQSF